MPIAQGHGELIRHLEAERARLSEANMMRLSRPAAADKAGLVRDEGEVGLIADTLFSLGRPADPALRFGLSGESLARFAIASQCWFHCRKAPDEAQRCR